MLDWLAVWGVTSAVGLVFKPILEDLAKDATKDWAKDLMKDSLKNVLRLPSKEPVDIAAGKALKEFLQLVQDELEDADVSEAELKQYIKPLKQFIKDKSVKEILGSAFKDDCQVLDAATLAKTWNQLNLLSLPDEFDWKQVGKRYVKKVKALIRESDELRALLDSQNLEGIEQNTKELVGIAPEFNLARYQEGIRERYANLNLDSLDTSVYDYREKLKVWQVFIAQNVRECQEYLPQVYEIPKEHQKRLRERNELEADFDAQEWERYKQVYYQQPVRSVLDVVNELQNYRLPLQPPGVRGENLDPPQPPLKRGEKDLLFLPVITGKENPSPSLVPPLNKGGLGGVNCCRYIVILGDPGSGKSTLLQYIALNWARTPLNNVISQAIPLLIELRSYMRDRISGQCKDFLEFFHKGSVICRLNQHQLHEQLKAGKVLVMFDGLDEVFDPAQREEVITDIHRFTNDYPNVRVIVTSRIIGYKPQRLGDAEFRHFMLQDLESDQIQDFIYRWHELTFTDEADKVRKRERLQQAIKTSSAIGELAGNPLLLTMMAILNRNQELPRDRPELYNQASRVLLHQWDVEQKLLENPRIDSVAIDYKDKQAMLRQVAYHMQAADKGLAGNLIRAEDLERILTGYLKSIEVSQARMVARLLIEQLRSRNFILCFLGADSYGFVHRTFLEYFCACEFVERFGKRGLEGGLTLEELKTEVFCKHWQDESWHEVLRLITGMIDTSFAGEIIDYLMALDGETQNFINLFLAANCLSDVRNRSLLGATATQLLNQLKSLTKYDLNYDYNLYEVGERASIVRDIRTKAVVSVSTIFLDAPETLSWLKLLALSDRDWWVRQAAMQELIVGWHNHPETLAGLKECDLQKNKYPKIDQAMELLIREIASESNPRILVVEDEPFLRENLEEFLSIVLGSQIEIALASNGLEALEALENKLYDVILMDMMMPSLDGWETTRRIIQKWSSQISSKEHQKENRPWIIALTVKAHDRCADVGIDDYLQKPFRITALFGALFDAITKNFRDDPEALALFKSRVQSDENWEVRRAAVRAITRNFPDNPETLTLLMSCTQLDENEEVRQAAVRAIVQYFPHEAEILPILKTCVQSDDYSYVRIAAVQELARRWKDDPDTLPILKQRVHADNDAEVLRTAVQELARDWKDDPDTLPILKTRALSDDHEDVRSATVQELARGWRDEPGMFDFLCDRAINDPFEAEEYWQRIPRQVALEVIIEQYREHPQTLPLLRDRAENDPDYKVRQLAVQELARGWKDEPWMFEFLCNCAINDPFERKENWEYNPRQLALEIIIKQYRDRPQTLPLLQDRAENDPDEKVREFAREKLAELEE